MLDPLMSISPVDGRYRAQTEQLSDYFSEFALIRYRVRVEIEYFIALCEIPLPQLQGVSPSLFPPMRKIYQDFGLEEAYEIKATEKITNHDVKAVEYFIKERFRKMGLESYVEFIHFGLTSQDINNTAIPLSLLEGIRDVYMPVFENLLSVLRKMEQEWAQVPMLARTHGQPASPTRLGKEIGVFTARLQEQKSQLIALPYCAKFGGATGNLNAHHVAYPSLDWNSFASHFIEDKLGLKRSYPTTQIEHYDNLAALFDNFKRINTILIDLCRDIWTYISMEYFRQKVKAGEVGSSAMPHKVNPIDFENAEGNLGVANALYEHLAAKLPLSRLQRDLTDSTVLRNVGVPLAHSLLALKSLLKGLDKLILNRPALEADLEGNWAVVAEAIQTILRREGYPNPYETLKELTRGNEHISAASIATFIENLNVSEEIKNELKAITPHNYTGI
ncbi:MAG TPA: adenylosuccinate lyase [Bacteroidales bacterium]|jgi:adenylosuccinate lyase|nr:adenylosuccinate lyase [Bacteroidales bacterium]HPY22322.1 adenylosuccinate lyase [Bacteroidales bacterium]HQA93500.1 adenylosuccinate lyase [Bacteroidales bacterium]HQN24379.1 adenylosuccinate lyase [Bacteroidales bacterium]HQP79293.1 adenylosuccinate lyase [Bacteroidales bacterium]